MAENILHSGGFVDRNNNEITITFYKKSAVAVMTVEPTSLSFGYEAQTIRLKVYNSTGSLNITKSNGATWVSYSGGSASGYKYYDVSVTANSTANQRTATLTLTDSYNSVTVAVSQSGVVSSISVNPAYLEFNKNGETQSATVTWSGGSTPTYSFPGGTPTWVSISTSVSGNQMTITVNAGPNTETYSRSAQMYITNGISVCGLHLEQEATHSVSVNQRHFQFTAAGGTQQLTVSNIEGSFSMNYEGEGLELIPTYTSSTLRIYDVTYTANPLRDVRTGVINVRDTAGSWVQVTTEQAASTATFSVDPTSFEYGGSGSTNRFMLYGVPSAGLGYSIPSAASGWVSVTSLNTVNGYVDITVAANPDITSRTTVVTLYNLDDQSEYVTVTVNQEAGQSSLSVSPTSITFFPRGGTEGVVVTWTGGNTPTASIRYVQGEGGWLTEHSGTPSGGTKSFSWTATSNYDSSSRTAVITITNGLQSEYVTVSQSSAPAPAVFTVNPSSISTNASASTTSVTFTYAPSAIDYSISYNGGNDWITVSDISSSGATISLGLNVVSLSRTATVMFIDESNPSNYVSVSISQDGNTTPALSVMDANMSFIATGERKQTVVNNIVGALTHTEPDWISLNMSGSGGSRLVSVTAASNISTSQRNGSVIFNDARSNPVSMSVAQSGLEAYLSVSPTSIFFSGGPGSSVVTANYVGDYVTGYVSAGSSWFGLSKTSDVSGTATFAVSAVPNIGSTSRSGSIRIETESQSADVSIAQQAAGEPLYHTFGVSPDALYVGTFGETQTIQITSMPSAGLGYYVGASWVQSVTIENNTCTVTFSYNGGSTTRSTILCLYALDDFENRVYIPIRQIDGSGPALEPTSMSFGVEGGTKNYVGNAYSGSGRAPSISYEGTATNWLSVYFYAGATTGFDGTITASSNTGSERSALLTYKDSSGSYVGVMRVTQEGVPTTLSASPSEFTFNDAGGTDTIDVYYEGGLTTNASGAAGWMNYTLLSSETEHNTYEITVLSNTASDSRTAVIEFEDYLNTISVPVHQLGHNVPALSVLPSTLGFDSDGEVKEATVNNIDGVLVHTEPAWVSVEVSDYAGSSKKLNVTATHNPSISARTGSLVIDDDRSNPVTVALEQEGMGDMYASPSVLQFSNGSAAVGTTTLNNVYGSVSVSTSFSWITVGSASSQSGNSVTYPVSVKRNSAEVPRYGIVTFTDERGVPVELNVQEGTSNQPGVPLSMSPSWGMSISATGTGSVEFTDISGLLTWGISRGEDWITIGLPTSGTYTLTIPIYATPNASTSSRTGYLWFGDNRNGSMGYTLVQSGRTVISTSPSVFNFSSSSQSGRLYLSYEGVLSSSISGGDNWLTVSQTATTSHRNTYAVNVTDNSTYASRSATLTFEDSFDTVAVPVNQDPGEPTLLVTPNRMDFPATLSYSYASVTYPAGLSVSVSVEYNTSYSGWITVNEPPVISGDVRTYTIDIEPNDGPDAGQEREAQIVFEGELGGADEIYVYQSGQN